MTYYKVKPACDGMPMFPASTLSRKHPHPIYLITQELFTLSELRKYVYHDSWFDKVELSPRKTYHSFGARFIEHSEEK